ncbi:chitosanase [Streptomyces sp. NPDC051310]|uniref:chitosanase n=1 Tax=Streptomyces sp. NPDC051310 TaxID=3365649 RepID=UPI0037930F19
MMLRARWLLFAVAPLLVLAIFTLTPTPKPEATEAAGASESQGAAKRAEEELESAEELLAKMPPGLAAPDKKELAHQILGSAMNSTKDWRTLYGHIADSDDGDGYCGGVIGFCSGTKDMRILVESYTKEHPDNALAAYVPALRAVDGTDSHEGLGTGFVEAWQAESEKPAFRKAQDAVRDSMYFKPAVDLAKLDGLGTLGQFIYYDAMVFHGPGIDKNGFYEIRERVRAMIKTKAEGGKEKEYLDAFLDACRQAMTEAKADQDTSRIDTAQRAFLRDGNLTLRTPLVWKMYGETFRAS